jgi:hypothetical protein
MTSPKQKSIRPRSKKRATQEREYAKIRKVYLFCHPVCEVIGCGCESTEIHHKKGRVGELLTDERFFLAVCRPHHNYIESHPFEARDAGYSLSRLSI